jgi:hypothetical protein
VTLNIALVKKTNAKPLLTWTTTNRIQNSPAQNKQNIDTYLHMMRGNDSSIMGEMRPSYGWLQAYSALHAQLLELKSKGLDKNYKIGINELSSLSTS